MTAVVKFPSYWGPEGGDPVLVKDALFIEEGWVEHFGHYDVQIGQWVPQGALAVTKNGGPEARDRLKALRVAYKKKLGKKAFNGWDEAEPQTRIDAS